MHRTRKFLRTITHKLRERIDPGSLQFRLTLEIAALTILSLSGVAVWASWTMQQTLISAYMQNMQYIATRFARDVELYSEMMPVDAGLTKSIQKVSAPNLLVWVNDPEGRTLVRSALVADSTLPAHQVTALLNLSREPTVRQVEGRDLILYGAPLKVQGKAIGDLYVIHDITDDWRQLKAGIQSLVIVSGLAIAVMIWAIAIRIRHFLRPIREVSQIAGAISPNDLGQTRLQIQQAPSEVEGLVRACNMMLERLSEAWEQQREFVSNVSHELRTPLTVVHGYLQSLLRRSTNLNAYELEALETAAFETDRTVRLLQDLLDLARADSGYIHFHIELLMLNDLVIEVADMTQKFSNRAITVIEKATDVRAMVDRDRLRQVLINLIDNAVKYSDSDQPIQLLIDQTEGVAMIQICDRGVGIPVKHQTRIFERFYRVDEARTRATGGCGLGLAIVKTLVEGMNGQISVRSKPNEGSTFTITFPG